MIGLGSGIVWRVGPARALHDHLGFDRPELYIPATILAYIAGHLLSFLSSITVERYALRQLGYPSHYLLRLPSGAYAKEEPDRKAARVVAGIVGALLLPITLPEQILSKLGLRELYAKPLDSLLVAIIATKLEHLLRDGTGIEPTDVGKSSEHDFFRYVYHFAVENAPNHLSKMQNYVALYGFLRTISFVAVVNFWVMVGIRIAGRVSLWTAGWYCLLTGGVAFLAFLAFSKFYRRFTLEALMAMSAVHKVPGGA
jgi:hypothetical protein